MSLLYPSLTSSAFPLDSGEDCVLPVVSECTVNGTSSPPSTADEEEDDVIMMYSSVFSDEL